MKFKAFSNVTSDNTVTYSYTKRGTVENYWPNNMCERIDGKAFYDKTCGNLFYGIEVSWMGATLLDKSVDININLGEVQYVDHIYIQQSKDSKPRSVEILTLDQNELKKIGVYSTGEVITEEEITISVGYYCDNVVIRLNGAYENVGIKKLDIFSATEMENMVYPMPTDIAINEGVLSFDKITGIYTTDKEIMPAARYFSERLKENFGEEVSYKKYGDGVYMVWSERKDDGYDIEVNEEGCIISAGCLRGLMYAVDALMQLADESGFKYCKISDKPMMEFRGVHIALPARKDIPFLKKFIREVAVPMRYNSVIIQISAAMRYDNYPEINAAWLRSIDNYHKGLWPKPAHYGFIGGDILEKSEVAELCDYIRSFGLEIVPEIQCLSHAQYITTAYPELAEVDLNTDVKKFEDLYVGDEGAHSFYHHNMCPLHEKYYDYVFGIADEVVEVMKPERYLHMGHDEIFLMGACEKCIQEDKAKLFGDEVTKLNEYVKSKNLTMMIWSDMLQGERLFGEVYSTPEAINYIPKDVRLLDFTWYFHPELDLEDKLLANGFQVAMGNMYSSHYPRYDYRSKKQGVFGAEVSTWVACNEKTYAYEGKLYDMCYSANMMWNPAYDSTFRRSYNEIIKQILWKTKCRIANIAEEGEAVSKELDGSIRNIPNELLWHIPYDKAIKLSVQKPETTVAIEDYADTVFVVHATDMGADRVMWHDPFRIGEYTLIYEDDSSFSTEVSFGENIHRHAQSYGAPIVSVLFRHQGYTGTYSAKPICGKDVNGRDYTLLALPIKNPDPEKKIKELRLKHMRDTDASIFVYEVQTVKRMRT